MILCKKKTSCLLKDSYANLSALGFHFARLSSGNFETPFRNRKCQVNSTSVALNVGLLLQKVHACT